MNGKEVLLGRATRLEGELLELASLELTTSQFCACRAARGGYFAVRSGHLVFAGVRRKKMANAAQIMAAFQGCRVDKEPV